LCLRAQVDMIVRGSKSPLSIIIIGVGDADFSSMLFLDTSKQQGTLKGSNNTVASRDIVQFVAMRDYRSLASSQRLARDLLAGLPDQVTNYFMRAGILPSKMDINASVPGNKAEGKAAKTSEGVSYEDAEPTWEAPGPSST
jgi:Copine